MAAAEAIHRTTPSAYWPAIRSILEGRLALGLGQVTPDVAGIQLEGLDSRTGVECRPPIAEVVKNYVCTDGKRKTD